MTQSLHQEVSDLMHDLAHISDSNHSHNFLATNLVDQSTEWMANDHEHKGIELFQNIFQQKPGGVLDAVHPFPNKTVFTPLPVFESAEEYNASFIDEKPSAAIYLLPPHQFSPSIDGPPPKKS